MAYLSKAKGGHTMPGVSRLSKRTRCSFCPRECLHPRVTIVARYYGDSMRTVYRLCGECGDDTLKRLLSRPRGRLA